MSVWKRNLGTSVVVAGLLVGVAVTGASAQVGVIVGERAMPAPIVEVVPVAPRAGYNWVPGHWAWRGSNWFWVRGHHIRGVVVAMPVDIVEVVPARPSPVHVRIKGHHAFEGGAGFGIGASGFVPDTLSTSLLSQDRRRPRRGFSSETRFTPRPM